MTDTVLVKFPEPHGFQQVPAMTGSFMQKIPVFLEGWNLHHDVARGCFVAQQASAKPDCPWLQAEKPSDGWPSNAKFQFGDSVKKKSGSNWHGHICGWYRTGLTELGYAVESFYEQGSVQIYPEKALEAWDAPVEK